jgi:hypothetical protein
MGEYIPPPGAFVRDLDDEVAERSPENEGTERTLGDEVTDRNLEFINELRGFQISDLELPQVSVLLGSLTKGCTSRMIY